MGDEADDILQSFSLTEANRKKYDPVKTKSEGHFIIKCNVIFERAKFNMRVQKEGEPVDNFITDLYTLAEHCNFGTLHDELIRDRIVVGIRDKAFSEKLQLEAELTLERAINQVKQKEAVRKQKTVYLELRGIPQANLMWIMLSEREAEIYSESEIEPFRRNLEIVSLFLYYFVFYLTGDDSNN